MLGCGVLIGDCRFTAIDFESAGAAPGRTDVPVQIGICTWSHADRHGEPFVSYLAADSPITWTARKVHGIRDEDLVGAPTLLSLWPELKTRLRGAAVVAHAKGTEKRFLRTFPGHGFGPWVDTLLLARAAWPELPGHSLSELCDVLGLTPAVNALIPGRKWHDALYDAAASMVLLEHLLEVHELHDRPVEILLNPGQEAWWRLRR
jgi:DNA polymerase-3 subunit epsilon